ncbi:MAG: molybdopterin-guanine dinucleotide biosynthesis protein B [Magnetococcales bacterium]|nr:molybdopterin-guanine dinucleotide biosynthesis protein B [Magnetococcales bacterium]
MNVMGFAAPSGTGKTTLMVGVIAALHARGLRVATLKHGHHAADPDIPGKDTHRMRQAGAESVLFSGPGLWFMIQEPRGEPPGLEEHLARLAGHDLILIEGYLDHSHPKIAVYRSSAPQGSQDRPMKGVVAVACDQPPPVVTPGVTLLPLDDAERVAAFIMEFFDLPRAAFSTGPHPSRDMQFLL